MAWSALPVAALFDMGRRRGAFPKEHLYVTAIKGGINRTNRTLPGDLV